MCIKTTLDFFLSSKKKKICLFTIALFHTLSMDIIEGHSMTILLSFIPNIIIIIIILLPKLIDNLLSQYKS